jgi:DNA modification methylase
VTSKIAPDLEALAVPLDQLDALAGNPRRGDVEAVARSYSRFGQRKPIVARRRPGGRGEVLAGNTQLAAARELGWERLAVVWTDDDDLVAQAFALADNRTSDLGTYDEAALAAFLEAVHLGGDEELFVATSYTEDDLAQFLASRRRAETGDPDDIPPPAAEVTTEPGDIWALGPHRLMCGDCRQADDVKRLLAGAVVNLAITSPPYADRRRYDEASEFTPVPPERYVEWFAPVAANVAAHLAPDGSWFVNIKPGAEGLDTHLYVLDLVAAHVRAWGWHFATEFCWERNGVPKEPAARFKNQFEPVYQFARGDWKARPDQVRAGVPEDPFRFRDDFEPVYQFARDRWKVRPDNVRHRSDNAIVSLGPGSGNTSWQDRQGHSGVIPEARKRKHGTTKTMASAQGENVAPGEAVGEGWAYPGNRLPTFIATHEALGHTAAFPVGLPEWFIRAYTDPGDVVLDPFAGSGSTLVAADRQARTGYGVEISPRYCDVICRRWQAYTGEAPVLERPGKRGKRVNFGAPE